MVAISVKNLFKSYGSIHAVDDISFNVLEHSFTAFLGKNGAGKSTTINILATLLQKEAGEIKVFDHVLGQDDTKIRELIGVVFQQNMLDSKLTVYENLKIRAALYALHGTAFKNRLDELAPRIGIQDFLHQRYDKLSGGQRRKADIARALLNKPRILILDEPTTGLDPKSRKEIWQFIQKLRVEQNMSVLLTTHYLEEAYDADHVIVIHKGKIIDQASSVDLRAKYTKTKLYVTSKKEQEAVFDQLPHLFEKKEARYQFRFDSPFAALALVNQYQDKIQHFEIIQGTMDDVFLSLTEEVV